VRAADGGKLMDVWERGLKPVSRAAFLGWTVFYVLFLVYAATNTTGFLLLDHANLMIHEAGHVVFSWDGETLQILGGTLAQILVPAVCTYIFLRRRETLAVAFCAFWMFENLLYVATYMGDARTSALPLVGGDESDWTLLFTRWGVLQEDRTIAAWTRSLGWIGMLATIAWLAWMHVTRSDRPAGTPIADLSR
jgi:hypothetical protein